MVCSHPARKLELSANDQVAFISSITGQATSFWLKDLTKIEVNNYCDSVIFKDSLFVFRDQNNFVVVGKCNKGDVYRSSKRYILLRSFKKRVRFA